MLQNHSKRCNILNPDKRERDCGVSDNDVREKERRTDRGGEKDS